MSEKHDFSLKLSYYYVHVTKPLLVTWWQYVSIQVTMAYALLQPTSGDWWLAKFFHRQLSGLRVKIFKMWLWYACKVTRKVQVGLIDWKFVQHLFFCNLFFSYYDFNSLPACSLETKPGEYLIHTSPHQSMLPSSMLSSSMHAFVIHACFCHPCMLPSSNHTNSWKRVFHLLQHHFLLSCRCSESSCPKEEMTKGKPAKTCQVFKLLHQCWSSELKYGK